MTEKRYIEICEGIRELLKELSKSEKYDNLDTETIFEIQKLQNSVDNGLFLHMLKGLELDE